jgi:hypothetical protein
VWAPMAIDAGAEKLKSPSFPLASSTAATGVMGDESVDDDPFLC